MFMYFNIVTFTIVKHVFIIIGFNKNHTLYSALGIQNKEIKFQTNTTIIYLLQSQLFIIIFKFKIKISDRFLRSKNLLKLIDYSFFNLNNLKKLILRN